MADGMRTRLVETLCHDCVIRVLWFFGEEDPRFNYIDVQLISSHSEWWHLRWRNRLRNAWAVLRGRYDWSGSSWTHLSMPLLSTRLWARPSAGRGARRTRRTWNVDEDLDRLAALVRRKNELHCAIAELIGRPATPGNIGEFVAARVFRINLVHSGSHPGYGGVFEDGPLAGRTVNIKAYSRHESVLDVGPHPCDFYLVLTGPSGPATDLPWRIDSVFLFVTERPMEGLQRRGVKVGVATSVLKADWEAARIFPLADRGGPKPRAGGYFLKHRSRPGPSMDAGGPPSELGEHSPPKGSLHLISAFGRVLLRASGSSDARYSGLLARAAGTD